MFSDAFFTLFSVQKAFSFLAPLQTPHHRADFVERIPEVTTCTDKTATLNRLQPHHEKAANLLGFTKTYLCEQIHGAEITLIDHNSPLHTEGVDGLITREDLLLGIHVADCGAVYLLDPVTKAHGLLHSGKKGTELNITGKAISQMQEHFGSKPADLIVALAPCIRPPHYEIDFAATIREQALSAGVTETNYHDCKLCTASNLERFYSYRIEKGNTGRHLALLGRSSS